MWKYLLPLLVLAGCGNPLTTPRYSTGDVVVVVSDTKEPTEAELPCGIVYQIRASGNNTWVYSVAFQGHAQDYSNEAKIRKIGHLDWSDLPDFAQGVKRERPTFVYPDFRQGPAERGNPSPYQKADPAT